MPRLLLRHPVAPPAAPALRPDIEGLRALAVLLVVLGHAGAPFLGGGFVGVDVFFVISGYLITGQLRRERRLGQFYARRMLRLMPVAALVSVVTLAGAWWWLSPVRFPGYAVDGLAAATWSMNIRLAVTSTDYFATGPPSPFQHFWSLAVEEQFYLVWPLVLMLFRRRLVAALLVLIGVSFAAGVLVPDGYFGTHTRAWELGAGALLALVRPLPSRRLALAGWAAILVAAFAFDDRTAYPGFAALLPVLGTVAVIAARAPLFAAPMLGRLSYGWYLWHWPLLVILGAGRGPAARLALCLLALGLAAITYHLVENPVRHLPALRRHPARGIGLGLALSAVVAGLAIVAASHPPPVGASGAAAAPTGRTLDTLLAGADRPAPLPANLTPPLAGAAKDLNRAYRDGCHVSLTGDDGPACGYGDPAAARSVVLFGDSHAAQWFPAFEELAVRRGWRLWTWTRSGCSPAGVDLDAGTVRRPYPECTAWRTRTLDRIRRLAPDLVVVSGRTGYRDLLAGPPADPDAAWRAGWERTVASLRHDAGRVVVLGDVPRLPSAPADCLAAHAGDVSFCAPPVASALDEPGWRAAVRSVAGPSFVDPVPWLCAARCPVVLGNVLVYRDDNHITGAYARLVADRLGDAARL